MGAAPTTRRPRVPRLSTEDARQIAREAFGVEGEATALASYVDLNFRIHTAPGEPDQVLKVAHASEDRAVLAMQQEVLEHLHRAAPGLAPALRAALTGESDVEVTGPDGQRHRAWMVEYLAAPLLSDRKERDRETWRGLGERLAELGQALEGVRLSPPADAATERFSRWDLARSLWTIGSLPAGVDDRLGAALRTAQARFASAFEPCSTRLPVGLTHHDANDQNLLIAHAPGPARVRHVIDFGDLVRGPRVFELAVAAAYALLDAPDPLQVLTALAEGWERLRPMNPDERRLLLPAACMRLVVSVAIATQDAAVDPENAYLALHQGPIARTLPRLLELDPRRVEEALGAPAQSSELPREEVLALRRRRMGPSLSLSYSEPLEIEAGRGAWLFDKRGRPFLDCVNNVCHVGHCHPTVVAAGRDQMARLNTNSRYLHDHAVRYAERLAGLFPAPLEVVYFVSSGSEANELALRIARTATGRHDVIAVEAGYHGNTSTLVDVSHYKHAGRGGRGTPPWVHIVPLPDPYRGRYRAESADPLHVVGDAALAERYAAHVAEAAAAAPCAAFLTEPLIGCGGQVVPPPGWLARAFEHARAAGVVCIADEVQVGFGRVGSHLWAFEAQGAIPDIVTLGKPIGNGHPLAAVITTRALADAFANGMEYFATFGGNPVSCAIGMAVLDVLEAEELQANAAARGAQLLAGFRDLAAHHPAFRERFGTVRGQGLYLGVEIVKDPKSREPDSATLAALLDACRARGVLLSADGPAANVLKIKPPLVFSEADARLLLDVLSEVGTSPNYS